MHHVLLIQVRMIRVIVNSGKLVYDPESELLSGGIVRHMNSIGDQTDAIFMYTYSLDSCQ